MNYKAILFTLCCALTCFAQKANTPPPSSATSTIEFVRKNGVDVAITTNRQFKLVPLYIEDAVKSVLLLEEVRTESSREVEGDNSTMKVDAWIGSGNKPDKKAWTIKTEASVGEADDPFYRTTAYGCCASYNVFTWYHLLTGQKVFTGTNNLVKISVPNTGGISLDRYVTFHSNQGTVDTPEMKRLKDVLGVLQYGTSKRATHRILVRTTDPETLELGVPDVGVTHQKQTEFASDDLIKEVALWAFDGKKAATSLSDFTVILKWEDTLKIEIPFKNDAPVLSEPKVPTKVKLEIPAK